MNLEFEIRAAFNKHASEYEQFAKVQFEVGQRLFERLQYLKMAPRYVLDIGCGPGIFTLLLKKYYPKAQVIGLDLSYAMLFESKKKQRWRHKWSLVNGNMSSLPFRGGVFDLVFANQVIHWASSLPKVFQEFHRVLSSQGCLMFSTLGPDTFKELRQAWTDRYAHTNEFMDMHDLGDCLLLGRWVDSIVDMELLTIHYPALNPLLQSLKAQGVKNINQGRNEGLTGRKAWQVFKSEYQKLCTPEGKYPLTYEAIYGHAWKGPQRKQQGNEKEIFIPLSQIKHQK